MEIDFKNYLVYGTYFILWTVLLNTVFSDMTTVACPTPCVCSPATSCNGTSVGCSNKGLKEVPAGIPKDTCNLYLYNNQISRIDNNAFKGLTQLESLNLRINQITRIDNNTFDGLSQLQTLILWGNQITRIDNDAFAGLSQLRKLYLHQNQITMIDSNAFAGLSQLKELYLHNNMITSIESIVFEKLPKLQKLYVGGNPFQCTCDLRSFVEFMQRKGILPHKESNVDEPRCSSSDYFKGMEIINVPYYDMSCDSTSSKYSRIRIHSLTLMWRSLRSDTLTNPITPE